VLYDADRIEEAASAKNEQDLYEAQLDLLLDPSHPETVDGPDVLARLRSKGIAVAPVIVVSAGMAGLEIARAIGAAAYYPKPIDLVALADKIRELTRSGARASAPDSDHDDVAAS